MCDKETNPILHVQRIPVPLLTEFLMEAERELAAFYEAVSSMYGPQEAGNAAQNWIEDLIEGLKTMDRFADGVLPNCRRATLAAADRLTSRRIGNP
jgi:hypothetical protein